MRYAAFHSLETERLLLRQLQMEDIYEYYERLFGDADVSRYMLFEPHQDIGESLESLQRKLERYEEGNYYCWGVTEKEEDSLIGLVELLRFDEAEESCSFVYMLGCNYWNRGYGTELLKAVFQFAFTELGVQRISADHMTKNAASGAVMRKAGMQHVGTLPGKYEKLGMAYDAEVYEIRNEQRKELTANAYQKLAMRSLNPALSKKDVLINGVMGLCGEAGECIDIVKKMMFQQHELDRDRLIEELGDVLWYCAELASGIGVTLGGVAARNIRKLKKRYPNGFDAERSRNREE